MRMKKNYTIKKVLLTVAALFTCSMSFAQLTETEATAKGADKNTDAVGISYTLPGDYIAGKGSSMTGTMRSKGLKLRTKVNDGKLEFKVNSGYTIVGISIDAVGNYVADDNSIPYVKVTGVNVDGGTATFEGGEFPEKGSETSGILTITGINAHQSVEIFLDNSNASAGTQINACFEITYEEAAAAEPTITLSPDTVNLIPGDEFQIDSKIVPGTFTEECFWYSGSIEDFIEYGESAPNDVIDLSPTGLVTAKGPGMIPVKLTWITNPGVVEDTTIVIVNDFNPAEHNKAQEYDFTAMGDVELAIGGESFLIWNDANSQCNGVQFCTNEGLENLAFQAVITEGATKGWKIVDGQGLYLTGAGRSAAVGALKAGQYLEIIYTGPLFATRDYTMDTKLGPDAGTAKKAISDLPGRAIYLVKDKDGETENLMVGFEINTGQYVKSITVYEGEADSTAIQEVAAAAKNGAAYNLMGIKVAANSKGLRIKDGKLMIVK